jgi:hypothetical protein
MGKSPHGKPKFVRVVRVAEQVHNKIARPHIVRQVGVIRIAKRIIANLAIYLTPPTPTSSVFGCGRGLSQDVA